MSSSTQSSADSATGSARKPAIVVVLAVLAAAVVGLTSSNVLLREAVVTYSQSDEDDLTHIDIRCPAGWLFVDFAVMPQNEGMGSLITNHGSFECPLIGSVEIRTNLWPPLSESRVPMETPTRAHTYESGTELWMLLSKEPVSDTDLLAIWRAAAEAEGQ